MATARDPITCHILDTTLGQPARHVRVRLEHTPANNPSTTLSSATATAAPATASDPLASPPLTSSFSGDLTAPASTSTSSSFSKRATATPYLFESRTDEDGRIRSWLPYASPNNPGDVPVHTLEDVLGGLIKGPTSRWTLRFDTGAYFAAQGKDTFFPEVAVVFEVRQGQHYHVPLLLAPYSYSTYRGS
ncbi:hypothetical protein BD289DRAFT_362954 [Coniella lustricola]|uniref:hydroxyisourate hydrolase n=1 Tax=Coniella lustricola TaxID=2025994 RepID=A0A2T3AFW2_9PEZI|nr:hypothetical protein BD289DRAFT_362954 [Coniella lustricola]